MLLRFQLCFGAILIFSVLCAQDISTSWDHSVEVQHGPEKFDKETLYAYSTIAYEVDRGDVKRLILEEVKAVANEKATKKTIKNGIKVNLPKFDGDDIAAKVKTEDVNRDKAVRVVVAFLKGEETVNPTDYPAGHEAAISVIRDLGLKLNRAVVEDQIRESEEELEDLQKKRVSLLNDKEGLQKEIMDAQEELAKLKIDNQKLKEKMSKAQADAASLEVMANASAAESRDLKKYSKARSKASKCEARVLKNEQRQIEVENEEMIAKQELPILEQEIAELDDEIEAQANLVAALEAKLLSIN